MGLKHLEACALSVSILLLCFILTGCNPEATSSSETSSAAVSQGSVVSSEKEVDAAFNEEETDISPEEMSYQDYFSKEREWVEVSNPAYSYNMYDDGTVTRYDVATDPLTGQHNEIHPLVVSKGLGYVSDMAEAYETLLFIVDGHDLIQSNESGQNQQLIYKSDGTILDLFATRELIYFLKADHTICRIYRPSGTLDEVVKTEKEISSFRPLSNYSVVWSVDTDEFKAFDATGALWEDAPPGLKKSDSYISNSKTGETHEVKESDYDDYGFLKYEVQD